MLTNGHSGRLSTRNLQKGQRPAQAAIAVQIRLGLQSDREQANRNRPQKPWGSASHSTEMRARQQRQSLPKSRLSSAKAQAGDRLAFEELVHRYDREVLRLALNLVHRSEDARDIYQESFMRVYKNLHRFRFECSFYTWLYRIVTNVALDHLRRRTSRREDQAPVPEEAEGGTRDFFDRQPEVKAGSKSGTKPARSGDWGSTSQRRSTAFTARAHGLRDETLSRLETQSDRRHARHFGRDSKEFAVPGDAKIAREPGLHAVTGYNSTGRKRMRQYRNDDNLNHPGREQACEEFDSRLVLLAPGELTPDERSGRGGPFSALCALHGNA